jgi:hypothetical protein
MTRRGGKHNSRQAGGSIPANAGRAEINSRYWFTGIPLAFWRKSGLCGYPTLGIRSPKQPISR